MHSVVKSLALFLDPKSELCSTWDQERIFKLLHWWVWGGIADTHHAALHRQALSGPCIITFSVHFFLTKSTHFQATVLLSHLAKGKYQFHCNNWKYMELPELLRRLSFKAQEKVQFSFPYPATWSSAFLYPLCMREKHINTLKFYTYIYISKLQFLNILKKTISKRNW